MWEIKNWLFLLGFCKPVWHLQFSRLKAWDLVCYFPFFPKYKPFPDTNSFVHMPYKPFPKDNSYLCFFIFIFLFLFLLFIIYFILFLFLFIFFFCILLKSIVVFVFVCFWKRRPKMKWIFFFFYFALRMVKAMLDRIRHIILIEVHENLFPNWDLWQIEHVDIYEVIWVHFAIVQPLAQSLIKKKIKLKKWKRTTQSEKITKKDFKKKIN